MEYRYYDEGRLHMVFGITNENEIRLLHFSSAPFEPKEEPAHYYKEGYQFAQINLSGLNRPYEKQGFHVCLHGARRIHEISGDPGRGKEERAG
jgi:alpha-galactosidase